MNQSKLYLIVLSFIWPFFSVINASLNFRNKFARSALIFFGFGFLGFTAIEEGDLLAYANTYYEKANYSFGSIIKSLFEIEVGKFYIDFISVTLSFLNNHHYYFALLFIIFGYFLINTIFQFFYLPFKKLSFLGKFLLLSFALYYSIRTSLNMAFYTGSIYFLYMIVKYIHSNKDYRYIYLSLLTPLFHIGLAPLLSASLMVILFQHRTNIYIVAFVFSLFVSQSSIINYAGTIVRQQDNALIENRYKIYVTEAGQEHLNRRYEDAEMRSNYKLRLLNESRSLLNYVFLPIGIILVWLKRKTFFQDKVALYLFNSVIATWSVTNIMMNISQGERFFQIHTFLIFGMLVYLFQKFKLKRFFLFYLGVLTIVALAYGFGALVASNKFINFNFLISNVVLESFELIK
jgi:hypothetical protein